MVYMPLNMDCLTEWCHVNRKLLMLLPQIHPDGPFVAGQLYCPWTSFPWVWSQASSVCMFKHWIFYSALSVPACFLKETWSTSYSRSVRGSAFSPDGSIVCLFPCSLIVCLGVPSYLGHLSCMEFSALFAFVIWCFSTVLESSWLFLLRLILLLHVMLFWNSPEVPRCFVLTGLICFQFGSHHFHPYEEG